MDMKVWGYRIAAAMRSGRPIDVFFYWGENGRNGFGVNFEMPAWRGWVRGCVLGVLWRGKFEPWPVVV